MFINKVMDVSVGLRARAMSFLICRVNCLVGGEGVGLVRCGGEWERAESACDVA